MIFEKSQFALCRLTLFFVGRDCLSLHMKLNTGWSKRKRLISKADIDKVLVKYARRLKKFTIWNVIISASFILTLIVIKLFLDSQGWDFDVFLFFLFPCITLLLLWVIIVSYMRWYYQKR